MSKNAPGIFFGTINGRKGYFERPERSTASPMRQEGLRSVRDVGRLRSIIDMSDQAKKPSRPLQVFGCGHGDASQVWNSEAFRGGTGTLDVEVQITAGAICNGLNPDPRL